MWSTGCWPVVRTISTLNRLQVRFSTSGLSRLKNSSISYGLRCLSDYSGSHKGRKGPDTVDAQVRIRYANRCRYRDRAIIHLVDYYRRESFLLILSLRHDCGDCIGGQLRSSLPLKGFRIPLIRSSRWRSPGNLNNGLCTLRERSPGYAALLPTLGLLA